MGQGPTQEDEDGGGDGRREVTQFSSRWHAVVSRPSFSGWLVWSLGCLWPTPAHMPQGSLLQVLEEKNPFPWSSHCFLLLRAQFRGPDLAVAKGARSPLL